jgi:hypothetical protein
VIERTLPQILREKLPSIRVKFEPRDIWIGVYWNKPYYGLEVYICVVPCLPIKLQWYYDDQLPF